MNFYYKLFTTSMHQVNYTFGSLEYILYQPSHLFPLVNEIIISSSLYRTKKLAAAVYYLNALLT